MERQDCQQLNDHCRGHHRRASVARTWAVRWAQLLTHMLHERRPMRTLDTRALTVTPKGRNRLAAVFDISS